MKHIFLRIFLTLARACGCFSLCRWITRRDIRILTYHGIALDDEWKFRSGLFISPETFRRRMEFLSKQGYPVVGLDDAIKMLDKDSHKDFTTVITIDDGWYGTALYMAPILKKFDFSATLYLCSYYMEKQTQVFNVAVDYLLWKANINQIDLNIVSNDLQGIFDIRDSTERENATKILWEYSKTLDSAIARQSLLRKVCKVVGIDPEEFEKSRLFSYVSCTEASELKSFGIDIQLHTHRHQFPTDSFTSAKKEIEDNRFALQKISSSQLNHFCYPSGNYKKHQLDWLRQMNIISATTTNSGFNTQKTGKLELKRFLDWEQISNIEFEAELSGFLELFRRIGISI